MESIYVGHNRDSNYIKELYNPLKSSKLYKKFNIELPHENCDTPFNSKDFLKSCSYMIAEVSNPSIGLGIELGWANIYNVKVICIYKEGRHISSSLKVISNIFIEYKNENDLIEKLEDMLE